MNPVIQNILNRKSTRSFTDKSISKDDLNLLLRAGMSAPSAMNQQPLEFIVITDKEQKEQIAKLQPFIRMAQESAACIVVCGDMDSYDEKLKAYQGYWAQDASATTENILLAAESLGISSVWTGVHPIMQLENRVRKFFNLPDNIIPFCIIVLGYSDDTSAPKDKWNEDKVHWGKY